MTSWIAIETGIYPLVQRASRTSSVDAHKYFIENTSHKIYA
jgi:hypothetical protein